MDHALLDWALLLLLLGQLFAVAGLGFCFVSGLACCLGLLLPLGSELFLDRLLFGFGSAVCLLLLGFFYRFAVAWLGFMSWLLCLVGCCWV